MEAPLELLDPVSMVKWECLKVRRKVDWMGWLMDDQRKVSRVIMMEPQQA
jgi:hypothetical protein